MSVSPERWAQIKSVVTDAMALPENDRVSFVARSCGDDSNLRLEVESLLRAGDGPTPFAHMLSMTASLPAVEKADAVVALLSEALGHQYEIIRELGRGGMGAVYLARERALERLVAIKVLKPELAASSASRERFRREARIAANLSHPGILQLHTFGEIKGVWYFVMSYVRGETLAELLRKRGKLPSPEAHQILIQLADALACAHKYQVVHRDIKPANVLLDAESGRAVLADFGISKIAGMADKLTASGAVLGTPHYMSPEQTMGGSDVDERSDIYSLGAVGYNMLSGQEPFPGENAGQVMYARLVRDPVPLLVLNPSVPPVLADVVMKCLSRDRLDRWESAESLKRALVQAASESDESLPEGVRDLPSFGPYALVWFGGWTMFALFTARTRVDRGLLMLVAIAVPIGLALNVWMQGGRETGFRDMLRVALRPPTWWTMYWPRSLRRPSDIWCRLPLPARLVRIALSAFQIIVPGAIIVSALIGPARRARVGQSLVMIEVATIVITLAAIAGGVLWARRHSLGGSDALRLMLGPTASTSGWNSPAITRVLSAPSALVRAPDKSDPADYRRAIREVGLMLPAGYDGIPADALDLADRIVDVIQRQNAEIVAMQQEAGPAESDRLQLRLAGLGDENADDTAERVELRRLLRHELELVWRMRDRVEIATRKRDHRFELLSDLYRVMCESCSATSPEADTRLRVICDDLRTELQMQTIS